MLLGYATNTSISRLELRTQAMTLSTALGYHIVLDQPLSELLPGMFKEIDTAVIERATLLLASLEDGPSTPYMRRRVLSVEAIREQAKQRVTRMYEYTEEGPTQARLFD